MLGERLESVELTEPGLAGDRARGRLTRRRRPVEEPRALHPVGCTA
ncbi:MAG TPA: hypothetical protein VFW97_16145 [Acidimicrobiia bacterium]|nr:hypothetical protein [Acidimicrobiia bacterium]